LADAFMQDFCSENGIKPKSVDPALYAALGRRKWPGNVRELKNVIERAAILAGDVVTVADLPEDPHVDPFDDGAAGPLAAGEPYRPARGDQRLSLREVRQEAERHHIVQTLVELDWNVSRAAGALGVERTNLHKKIRAYKIQRGEKG